MPTPPCRARGGTRSAALRCLKLGEGPRAQRDCGGFAKSSTSANADFAEDEFALHNLTDRGSRADNLAPIQFQFGIITN
jgi:hypothetical protein